MYGTALLQAPGGLLRPLLQSSSAQRTAAPGVSERNLQQKPTRSGSCGLLGLQVFLIRNGRENGKQSARR